MEQKYRIATDNGSILWNVGSMLKDVSRFEIKQFNVAELSRNNNFNGNSEYAMQTDVTMPLIIVELCDDKYKLIDGNHRLFNAMKMKVENISAYLLKKNEHICYIEDFNKELYDKIILEF